MSELSQLRWRCRRGMKELDVALTGYLENHYEQAEETEQESFRTLLEMQERDLFELIIGHNQAEDETTAKIIAKMRSSLVP